MHVGETWAVQGPVVQLRRLADGRAALELGQLYPDPTGVLVLVSALDQRYLQQMVCVSGTIHLDNGTPVLRVANAGAVRLIE